MKKRSKKIKLMFNIGDMVVYPSHGVGQIVAIENMDINKIKIKYFAIQMEQDNLVLRIPLIVLLIYIKLNHWSMNLCKSLSAAGQQL